MGFPFPLFKKGHLWASHLHLSKSVTDPIVSENTEHVLCLPVPEKNQRQTNFCIIPQYGDGINPPPDGAPAPESIVWTVADGPPKAAFTGNGQPIATNEGETAEQFMRKMLNENLSQTQVVRPDEREFVSAMPEAHRKGEKAYHVKAFRGSKEGRYSVVSIPSLVFGTLSSLTGFSSLKVTCSFFPRVFCSGSRSRCSSSRLNALIRSRIRPCSNEPST